LFFVPLVGSAYARARVLACTVVVLPVLTYLAAFGAVVDLPAGLLCVRSIALTCVNYLLLVTVLVSGGNSLPG
jgi:hypothetical protein